MISHNRLIWLSLVAFAYTAVTLWSIHADLPSANNDRKDDWQQLIVAQQWQFDYTETEQILAKVKLNSRGELLLNSGLAKILAKAAKSLPADMNEKALERIALLVSKNFEDNILATLLISYYHLQYAEINQLKTNDKLTSFQATVALQNHYLGTHIADSLFGKQRSITRYLLERRNIRLKINKERESADAQ